MVPKLGPRRTGKLRNPLKIKQGFPSVTPVYAGLGISKFERVTHKTKPLPSVVVLSRVSHSSPGFVLVRSSLTVQVSPSPRRSARFGLVSLRGNSSGQNIVGLSPNTPCRPCIVGWGIALEGTPPFQSWVCPSDCRVPALNPRRINIGRLGCASPADYDDDDDADKVGSKVGRVFDEEADGGFDGDGWWGKNPEEIGED